MMTTSCFKANAAPANTSAPVSRVPVVAPEVEKLGNVLSRMSDRAKEAIPNGNPQEFLADLNAVLSLEKTFRADDVSLFYLIDKNTISAQATFPRI